MPTLTQDVNFRIWLGLCQGEP